MAPFQCKRLNVYDWLFLMSAKCLHYDVCFKKIFTNVSLQVRTNKYHNSSPIFCFWYHSIIDNPRPWYSIKIIISKRNLPIFTKTHTRKSDFRFKFWHFSWANLCPAEGHKSETNKALLLRRRGPDNDFGLNCWLVSPLSMYTRGYTERSVASKYLHWSWRDTSVTQSGRRGGGFHQQCFLIIYTLQPRLLYCKYHDENWNDLTHTLGSHLNAVQKTFRRSNFTRPVPTDLFEESTRMCRFQVDDYIWSFLTYTPTADLTKFGYVSSWRWCCKASNTSDPNWTLRC